MSYAVMSYKIRLEALHEVLAMHDPALAAWAESRCRDDLTRLDDWMDAERPASEYLADLMLGRPLAEEDDYLYGYCVKALCELWGAFLPNDHWSAMRYGWFDTVSAAAGYDFAGLIRGGPGVDIPAPEDFPSMGHIRRADLPQHLARLDGIDLTRIDDRQVVEAVEQVRSWVRECDRDDTDLVCFYH